jgi:hypothetical protein
VVEEWWNFQSGNYAAYYERLHRDGPGWRQVATGLESLAGIARERGIPAYLAIFPLFADLDAYPLVEVHRKVAAEAAANGLRVLDLLDVYRLPPINPDETLIADELHPNALGHAFAAVALLREMLARGDLPVTDRDLHRVAASQSPEAPIARHLDQHLAPTPATR